MAGSGFKWIDPNCREICGKALVLFRGITPEEMSQPISYPSTPVLPGAS
jgi:hypothetical protein